MKNKKRIIGSIENASILRKFSAIFLIMSLLPTLVLFYYYRIIYGSDSIGEIDPMNFNLVLMIIVVGVLIGYFAMRSVLKQIIKLVRRNRITVEGLLSSEQINSIDNEENEIKVLAKTLEVINLRLEENVKELEDAKATLFEVMKKVGEGVSNMDNIHNFLDLIIETITDAVRGKTGVLLLIDEESKKFEIEAVCGVDFNEYDGALLDSIEGEVFQEILAVNKPTVIENVPEKLKNKYGNLFQEAMLCTPLMKNEELIGLIVISGRGASDVFNEDERSLLLNIAAQTATAVENSRINDDMERTYFETISALALAVDAKDRYSHGHLDRVSEYCEKIGEKLGLDDEDITILREAARLHDLGKLGIPDDVLLKDGPLTDTEWLLMRKHPEIGESIIKPVRSLSNLCDIIRHHHEKLDGSGYPDGLKGDEITPLVRIVAVVDVFDAITTDRSYRAKSSKSDAIKELRVMGSALDQDIVDVLAEVY